MSSILSSLPESNLLGSGQTLIPDLVKGIRRVGDQFSEEDFLVAVEGVDDETHQLSNFCLKGESFSIFMNSVSGHFDSCILDIST